MSSNLQGRGRGRGRGKRKKSETGFEIWGGYMSAKISKLENQYKNEAEGLQEKKGIFSGIAIFVNGYTNPTGEELKRIMLTNGGIYHHYYSKGRTTHIIASNLPNTKIQNLNTDFIVGPKWITDSLAAEKLLDYKEYLLYTHQSRNQPKLKFDINKSDSFARMESKDYKDKILANPSTSSEHEICNLSNMNEILLNTEKDISLPVENIGSDLSKENNKSVIPADKSSKRTTMNSSNPNFIAEYYNNSRLHHISASGAMFKQYVKDLQDMEDNFTGREYLKNWLKEMNLMQMENESSTSNIGNRTIMHIDMDCFFVSVGLINHPELLNQPVVVTHATRNSQPRRNEDDFKKEVNHFKRRFQIDKFEGDESEDDANDSNSDPLVSAPKKCSKVSYLQIDEKTSMSEIACCSYEARKRGVKNGMLLGVALKLCPELKTIPYDFEGYKTVSMDLYNIVVSYTKNIEAVSCDEMYVDLGDILKECRSSPLDFASCIRQQIQKKTKCSCSVGIGPNMITARMATKKAKPNGQYLLELSQVKEFMQLQSVSDLPGVGGSLSRRLEDKGVFSCGDLQNVSLSALQSMFGERTGRSLHDLCRGIDERPINKQHQRKSVSAEVNYGIRFENWNDAEKFLSDLSEEVVNRMTKIFVKGRTITLKLKVRAKDAPVETAKFMGHGICDNVAKSTTLCNATTDKGSIFRESLALLRQISVNPKDLRGVGIQVSKLESSTTTSSSSIKDFFANSKTAETISTNELKELKCTPPNKSVNGMDIKETNGKITKKPDKYMDKWINKAANPQKEIIKPSTVAPSLKEEKTIDIEVLNSLPADMRHQVLEEYRSLGYKIPPLDQVNSSPQAGPSNVGLFKDEEISEEVQVEEVIEDLVKISHKTAVTKNLADISYSQIDESFLDALPNDIKNDLQKDFKRIKNQKEIFEKNNFHKLLTPVQANPFKRKRGRPRGSQNKALTESHKRPGFDLSREMDRNAQKNDTHSHKELKSGYVIDRAINLEPSTSSNCRNSSSFTPNSGPNLCGESELGSVKALLSQWIDSCETPADIDISILTTFCTSLITEKDLEKLELILLFLQRKVKSGSLKWKGAFDLIVEAVQIKMMECHEAPLGGFLSQSRRDLSV